MTWNPERNKAPGQCANCRKAVAAGEGRWWSDWGRRLGQRVKIVWCEECFQGFIANWKPPQ